ncbi:MAG: glycosyltransferase [Pseudomonadota bacterium]
MKIHRLDRRERRAMHAALLGGEPLWLELWEPPPPEVRLDDVAPLCHAVDTWDPRLTASLRALLPPAARHGCGARVSVIVPSHRRVPWGLSALAAQDLEVEILVVDNGPEPLAGDALGLARVLRLPWEGHGRTRQRAVEQASGDYIFFTVDDAIPCGAGFLRTLVEALEEGGYDAVTARQLPWPDGDPITARYLRAWTPPGSRHRFLDHLDHVAALHRRATLLACPLPDVPIAEDLHWGRGRRLGYEPRAPVVHAHARCPGDLWHRTRAIHAQHLALGEAPRVPHLGALLGALPGLARPVLEGGPREILNQGAELFGQYAAARAARR